jgi:hypothetical protein
MVLIELLLLPIIPLFLYVAHKRSQVQELSPEEQLRRIATKKPRAKSDVTLPPQTYTITVTAQFQQNGAYATQPMKTLVRLNPPPYGRQVEWLPCEPTRSFMVPANTDQYVQVQSSYRGRTFINWLITPAPPGPIVAGNPLHLYMNEDKQLAAQYT